MQRNSCRQCHTVSRIAVHRDVPRDRARKSDGMQDSFQLIAVPPEVIRETYNDVMASRGCLIVENWPRAVCWSCWRDCARTRDRPFKHDSTVNQGRVAASV